MRLILACILNFTVLANTFAADSPQIDTFDLLDQALEEQFIALDAELEAQYNALDEALAESFKRLEDEVRAKWGSEDTVLPDNKVWVDYSADKSERRVFDFENGVLRIEQLLAPGQTGDIISLAQSLATAAGSARSDSMVDLSGKDQALLQARAELARQNIPLSASQPESVRPVLGSLLERIPPTDELALALDAAIKNGEHKSKKVVTTLSNLGNGSQKIALEVPLRLGFKSTLAGRYTQAVRREAARQDLPASLVFAMIETESSFNPRARSPVPAFGLMQLVPRSGGMDAYQHVYGEKTLLDPEYLFDADQNVELGAGYLNLLLTRYLRKINDPKSREYCAIAAYNTGAGNVARSFVGTTSVTQAAVVINNMTPADVLSHLKLNLPYEETRRYITKVLKARDKYRSMDQVARIKLPHNATNLPL